MVADISKLRYVRKVVTNYDVSINSIYDEKKLKEALDNYKLDYVDFRPPKRGEYYINAAYLLNAADDDMADVKPRLIVTGSWSEKTYAITAKELYTNGVSIDRKKWKIVDFRKVAPGDQYITHSGDFVIEATGNSCMPYLIVVKIKKEEENGSSK